MFKKLAENLADHLASYCFSAKRRGKPRTTEDHIRLHREARELLRLSRTSGESGELLIYFLLEAVLGASQLVAKMDLKTNRRMESLGSDGIHINWIEDEKYLDIYFAESKLEKTASKGIRNAVDSLQDFHKNRQYEHELRLVTGHFKYADERARKSVVRIIEGKEPGVDCRLRHACLVGYDWHVYSKLPDLVPRELTAHFKGKYEMSKGRLHCLIEKHFAPFDRKTLEFEIFFLPFRRVQEFRDAFYKAV